MKSRMKKIITMSLCVCMLAGGTVYAQEEGTDDLVIKRLKIFWFPEHDISCTFNLLFIQFVGEQVVYVHIKQETERRPDRNPDNLPGNLSPEQNNLRSCRHIYSL